jgi:hypothetical protein
MCRKLHNMSETRVSLLAVVEIRRNPTSSATNLSNVARLPAHLKFVWVFNASYDGTIIYNEPV